MSEPYIGEIRMFAGAFVPRNYAWCDGRLLRIDEYSSLFSIIGTSYGGDGKINFALPDLRGRIPVGCGDTYQLGTARGNDISTLKVEHLPVHTHGVTQNMTASVQATTQKANVAVPTHNTRLGASWSSDFNIAIENYLTEGATEDVTLGGMSTSVDAVLYPSGSSGVHYNIQPSQAIGYIIAIQGTYPPRK